VREFLIACLQEIQEKPALQEGVMSHMYYEEQEERLAIIMDQIKVLTDGV
jgi:hypothetical protein